MNQRQAFRFLRLFEQDRETVYEREEWRALSIADRRRWIDLYEIHTNLLASSTFSPLRRWFERQLARRIHPSPCHDSGGPFRLRYVIRHPLWYARAWWYRRCGHMGESPREYLG